MSERLPLFEDLPDALAAVVAELGGWKRVGVMLRPDLGRPEAAGQWLRDCLNPDRREHLAPAQVLTLLREARKAGYHAAKHWLDAELGYEQGAPVSPQEQAADLIATLQGIVSESRRIAERLERVSQAPLASVTELTRHRFPPPEPPV